MSQNIDKLKIIKRNINQTQVLDTVILSIFEKY